MKKYLVLLVLLLGACTQFEPQLTQPSIFYRDAPVNLSELQLYVIPKKPHVGRLSVLMYPPYIPQDSQDRTFYQREFGRLFWQRWSAEKVFPTLVYEETLVYRNPQRAMALAASLGADLVVVGTVPYFYLGATQDDTAITVQMKIYDVKSGMMVFSMEQSGRVEKKLPDDFVLVKREHRMPESPLYAIINAIASDMAIPLRSWAVYEENAQGIVNGLTRPPAKAKAKPAAPGQDMGGGAKAMSRIEQELTDGADADGAPRVNLDIKFDVAKSVIRPESFPLLEELASALQGPQLKDKRVVIKGHTDSDGKPEYNLQLSKRRAEAVREWLVKRGVSASRLRTEGFGETHPIAPNTTPAGKQINRRVEVQIDQ